MWGTRLLLSAVRAATAASIPSTTRTIRPTAIGASYNPWTGAYSRGAVAYGPYGGAGVGARYNPRTGTYARGAVAYGPYGARGAAQAYNPRTGAYGATRQGSNVYGSWGTTGVQRGDQWATTSRVTNNATGKTTRVTQTQRRRRGGQPQRPGPAAASAVARTGSGDVYAGRDGNVYRKQGDSWQKYDNGGLEQRSAADAAAARAGAGRRAGTRVQLGFRDRPAGQPRFRRARRGHAAHARRRQRGQRRGVARQQLPRKRRCEGRWTEAMIVAVTSPAKRIGGWLIPPTFRANPRYFEGYSFSAAIASSR